MPGSLRQEGPHRVDLRAETLAQVQRFLRPDSVETTLAFYAEIDADPVLAIWQACLTGQKSRDTKGFKKEEQ